jgi:hypothetical protein
MSKPIASLLAILLLTALALAVQPSPCGAQGETVPSGGHALQPYTEGGTSTPTVFTTPARWGYLELHSRLWLSARWVRWGAAAIPVWRERDVFPTGFPRRTW